MMIMMMVIMRMMTNDDDDNEDGSYILHLMDFLPASIELPPDGSSLLVSQVQLGKETMSIVVKVIRMILKMVVIAAACSSAGYSWSRRQSR